MSKIKTLVWAGIILGLGLNTQTWAQAGAKVEHKIAAEEVEIKAAMVRTMAPGEKLTAAYFAATNNGNRGHKIVAVIAEDAKMGQIHSSKINEFGAAVMHRLRQLNVPAHKTINLEPGGDHIMLIDVQRSYKEGDKLNLVLVYEDGSFAKIAATAAKVIAKS